MRRILAILVWIFQIIIAVVFSPIGAVVLFVALLSTAASGKIGRK